MVRSKSGGGAWAVLVAALVLACLPASSSAALITGIGDQNLPMFRSPLFHDLGVSHVRVVVPWDTALTNDARAVEWIDMALARGHKPLVAFEKSRGVVCPGDGCVGPTEATYESAVAAFRARWPQVTDLTPWNEPNHKSQPTRTDPALAARYYNAARRACSDCRLVAGDLLDDSVLTTWLDKYEAALAEMPAIWGLHNYFDATYFSTQGVDKLIDSVGGEIWLTETGGIVQFSPEDGGGLAYDETRAADSIRWLYSLAQNRPRVTRMYLYHWQTVPGNDFDGGLVGPDGAERLGLKVVREHLPRQSDGPPPAGTPTASGASSTGPIRGSRKATRVRISGKGLRLLRRGLRVGVSCVSAPSRCSGRLVVRPAGKTAGAASLRLGMRFRVRPGRSLTRDLTLTRRQRVLILSHRRLRVSVCLDGAKSCRSESRPVRAG